MPGVQLYQAFHVHSVRLPSLGEDWATLHRGAIPSSYEASANRGRLRRSYTRYPHGLGRISRGKCHSDLDQFICAQKDDSFAANFGCRLYPKRLPRQHGHTKCGSCGDGDFRGRIPSIKFAPITTHLKCRTFRSYNGYLRIVLRSRFAPTSVLRTAKIGSTYEDTIDEASPRSGSDCSECTAHEDKPLPSAWFAHFANGRANVRSMSQLCCSNPYSIIERSRAMRPRRHDLRAGIISPSEWTLRRCRSPLVCYITRC